VRASELARELDLEFTGCENFVIKAVAKLDTVNDNCISFSSNDEASEFNVVLISYKSNENKTQIVSENPRLDFIRCLEWLENNIGYKTKSSLSIIHPTVTLGNNVTIEDGVSIGAHTSIEHNVVIHKGTIIGDRVIVRSNSVIGAQGFGFEKEPEGKWIRFTHLGAVIIGDDVEIGALNSVCAGTLSNTIISSGVKTDNLVHIAHNCIIGKNSIITACAELSGGVVVEDNVWIGPNSSIMQKIRIGKNSLIGLGSTVTKSVESNTIVAGSPAKKIRNNN
jgi:UDP-3-O-[3-hydroxymyristoyl] glucosamine N-acyltransferase